MGPFGTHTVVNWLQVIGYDEDLYQTRADDGAHDVYVGAPNLAIYGEQHFGFIAIEPVTISWRQVSVVAFAAELGVGYWNYDTWADASNDSWTLVYLGQLGVGGLALLATLVDVILGGGILLNYAILHLLFNAGLIGLTFLAEDDTANTTNDATLASYIVGGVNVCLAIASQVWFRVLKKDE